MGGSLFFLVFFLALWNCRIVKRITVNSLQYIFALWVNYQFCHCNLFPSDRHTVEALYIIGCKCDQDRLSGLSMFGLLNVHTDWLDKKGSQEISITQSGAIPVYVISYSEWLLELHWKINISRSYNTHTHINTTFSSIRLLSNVSNSNKKEDIAADLLGILIERRHGDVGWPVRTGWHWV